MTNQHDKAKRWQFGLLDVGVMTFNLCVWFAACRYVPYLGSDAPLHMIMDALIGLAIAGTLAWLTRNYRPAWFWFWFWLTAGTLFFILPYFSHSR